MTNAQNYQIKKIRLNCRIQVEGNLSDMRLPANNRHFREKQGYESIQCTFKGRDREKRL
jgi:hypothetical protein